MLRNEIPNGPPTSTITATTSATTRATTEATGSTASTIATTAATTATTTATAAATAAEAAIQRTELENTTTIPPATEFLLLTTKIIPVVTKKAIKAVIAIGKKTNTKKKMEPTDNTKPAVDADKTDDPHEERETFWILVYVFMGFAIFEVLCVALFFIYRHRRKRKQKRRVTDNATTSNYDNEGMHEARASTVSPPPAYPETIELYENETGEPRYSSIQQMRNSLTRTNGINLIENGIPPNMVVPEPRSRGNSHISQGRSIIVLPRDCVIVHASGSRKSRHSTHGESSTHEIGIQNNAGPTSDDNRSLYSWESFSSCYRTSTDEDYVSGSNRANWEEDSLYEEPDKVIQRSIKSSTKTFGLERLFALQESVIKNAETTNESADNDDNSAQNADENGKYANENICYANENGNENAGYSNENETYANEDKIFDDMQEDNSDYEGEHIYESAEDFTRDRDVSYYENAYDLPQDALAKCLGKPNKFVLKHVLHEDTAEDQEPSLNLGMEFVNNNEVMVEGVDVKLRPTRGSTLYLHHEGNDESDNRASNC
ncbi:Hypothetical predicted protein [Paramuricea clavata]|uniref:Uncharacterized protein n=1 Tax=Paramuricea clavata TaxID=317549 RepID=A0A7D9HI27_PARCT|nr:Hypothetical predicted protein [Paramuricea clavata]